ncbi:MAG: PqqD family protein [Planctomycetes bacterium]|nr:PqqD family protein [Planctomycetota bacterium]
MRLMTRQGDDAGANERATLEPSGPARRTSIAPFEPASPSSLPAGRKLAYTPPRVQSAAVTGALTLDVAAEWTGDPPDAPPTPFDGGGAALRGTPEPGLTRLPAREAQHRWSTAAVPLRRCAEVFEYPIDHEALLYDRTAQTICCVNETALWIWHRCDGASIHRLASELVALYDVEVDTALDHVTRVVEVLSLAGLLAWEDAHVAAS